MQRRLYRHALVALVAIALLVVTANAQARHDGHEMRRDSSSTPVAAIGASGIFLATVASPGVNDRTLAEGYLTQPLVMGMLATPSRSITASATLNFEGSTLKRGELNAGVYGEGYVDRRHPHTFLHELTLTAAVPVRNVRVSVTAGKGFVPFGTDDPMSRPFVKYPVNHHLAQLLERAMISGAVALGPIVAEVSAFNGDEPQSPSDMPNWDRFGDSWSARLTGRPSTGTELQASFARVESPEQPYGGGLDQRKMSISGRYRAGGKYFLAEWARSEEGEGGSTVFAFDSFLAESSLAFGRFTAGARAERSERPEEERTINSFRTPRPHSDLGIIGRTRWTVYTVNATVALPTHRVRVVPFAEVSSQQPRAMARPAVFEPESFYGASTLWSFSAGVRIGFGMRHERMGRYGAASLDTVADHGHDRTTDAGMK